MDFWKFAGPPIEGSVPYAATYSPTLVVLSFAVSVLAAFAYMMVLRRVRDTRARRDRHVWTLAGGIASGTGAWAMHFTAMLAFSLPTPIWFDAPTTALSGAPAILAGTVTAWLMSRRAITPARLAAAGLVSAIGVGSMHYIGMEAMRTSGAMRYSGPLFVLSIVVVWVLAAISLGFMRLRPSRPSHEWARLGGAATAAGAAVCGMHYTAMAAVRFYPAEGAIPPVMTIPPLELGALIAVLSSIFVASIAVGALVDQRLRDAAATTAAGAQRHRAVIETMSDGLIVFDAHGRVESSNPAAQQLLRHDEESMVGLGISDLFRWSDERRSITSDELVDVACQPGFGKQIEGLRRSGESFVTDLRASRTMIGEQPVVSVVFRDITAQVVAMGKMRRLAAALDHATDSVVISGRDGMIEYVNPAVERLLGYPRDQLIGSMPEPLGDLEDARVDGFEGYYQAIRDGSEWSGPMVSRHRDGHQIHTAATLAPIRDESGEITSYVSVGRDVTEERAAAARMERLAAAMDQASECIVIADQSGRIDYVNPAAQDALGLSIEDLVDTGEGGSGDDKVEGFEALYSAMAEGRAWSGTLVRRRPDGQVVRLETSMAPMRDPSGDITSYVSVGRDVTEQHEMELQLRSAQKLESIGQLAAGIAHEINTPTQYVGDNTRFLKEAFSDVLSAVSHLDGIRIKSADGTVRPEDLAAAHAAVEHADLTYLLDEIPTAIDQSLEGLERVARIVRAMKEFSHPAQDKTTIDLNSAIDSTITVASNEWKYVADMETDLDAELPPVSCLPGEINQVVLNMVVNAAHAITDVVGDTGDKGTIRVSTRTDGDWVEVRIGDTGGGIPEHVRERIFDPFFTTKEVGKGTGQGLAISHSVVVQRHGGTLTFETEMDVGTTFVMRLPLFDPEVSEEDQLQQEAVA